MSADVREDVCYGLLGPLVGYKPNELRMLKVLVSQKVIPDCAAQFADRVPETLAVCDFIPKVALTVVPVLPVPPPAA